MPDDHPTEANVLSSTLTAIVLPGMSVSAAFARNSIKFAILGPMRFLQGENHWASAKLATK